jgi:large subunit ribosomal protein L20
MVRVKKGFTKSRRHKKIKRETKGYLSNRRKSFKKAKEAVIKAGKRAYTGRRKRKRDLRRLWIIRINAALKKHDLKYSRFIKLLKDHQIELDRKILAQLVIEKPELFDQLVKEIK